MIDIKTKQTTTFPLDIFNAEIKSSIEGLAAHYSIPVDYMGVTALWTISSLSGNMYEVEGIKRKIILYCMMLGPSSLGKSVAHRLLCEDVIRDHEVELYANFTRQMHEYEEAVLLHKSDKNAPIPPRMPKRTIRTVTSATTEALIHYSAFNPAGFGVYFDEGKTLYQGGAYKKENNSVDFWNKVWNGDIFNELRVEHARERFVIDPAISVLAGMQTERISEMFNKDTRESGLINRFLFTSSDYILLNEDVDHFGDKKAACDDWRQLVRTLFRKGCEYVDRKQLIKFLPDARILYNQRSALITSQANDLIRGLKEGDGTRNVISYWGKLYQYFGRFLPILAILRDPSFPVIDDKIVLDAEKLYYYFRDHAKHILGDIISQEQTDLNQNEARLLAMLPDSFTATEAEAIAEAMRFSKSYFHAAFRRKYCKGFLRKSEGKYFK